MESLYESNIRLKMVEEASISDGDFVLIVGELLSCYKDGRLHSQTCKSFSEHLHSSQDVKDPITVCAEMTVKKNATGDAGWEHKNTLSPLRKAHSYTCFPWVQGRTAFVDTTSFSTSHTKQIRGWSLCL